MIQEVWCDDHCLNGVCEKCKKDIYIDLNKYENSDWVPNGVVNIACPECGEGVWIQLDTPDVFYSGKIISKKEWFFNSREVKKENLGVRSETIRRLMKCFPRSFINYNNELILELRRNIYINLNIMTTDYEVYMNIIEWKSRYMGKCTNHKANIDFIKRMNKFLGVNFSKEAWGMIYNKVGSGKFTERFINSGYDLDVLLGVEKENK